MPRASLVLIVTLLCACGGGDTAGMPDAPPVPIDAVDADLGTLPRVEPAACRFDVDPSLGTEGVGYACGDLVVAEDRAAPGRLLRLHYARFTSSVATNRATIYLDGGPGGDGQGILSYAAFLGPSFLNGLLVDGDFLVLGQRGTARSIPFLDCSAADCSDFAGRADLTAYNTAANADDVDDLRAALGLDQLDVYGISYGSRLGLEVLRRHGDRVRAAVIEGLVPAQIQWTAAIPASFYSALTGLDASCAADGACRAAYGDLESKFFAGVAALDADPVAIPLGGDDVFLDGASYAYVLFRVMYSRSSYRWLPLVISDLAVRRTDRVAGVLASWLESGGSRGISIGLYYSVVCGELYSPPDPSAFEAANAGVPPVIRDLFGGSYFQLLDLCATWPTGDLQAQLAQPVTSAVPTLVSSGRLDPITPPAFGDVAAGTLSAATVVVHENSGHGATLQTPCGTQNLLDFLAAPTALHDTTCAAAITTPYVLPSNLAAARLSPAAVRAELSLTPLPPLVHDHLRRLVAR